MKKSIKRAAASCITLVKSKPIEKNDGIPSLRALLHSTLPSGPIHHLKSYSYNDVTTSSSDSSEAMSTVPMATRSYIIFTEYLKIYRQLKFKATIM